jgi:hypothetical protein
MAWETKDTVQTAIAIASIAISLFTFTIVEQRTIKEREFKRAQWYQFSYDLGRRFGEAYQVHRDLIAASPTAEGYRAKLQRQEIWLQAAIQSSINQQGLQIEISKFLSGSDNENLREIVLQHIQEQYGAKTAVAFQLGQDMQHFTANMDSVWPDTTTVEQCAQTNMARSEAAHHNLLNVDPPKGTLCELDFMNHFPSAVLHINDELRAIGVGPLIKDHPKTMEEARGAVAETVRALQAQWGR